MKSNVTEFEILESPGPPQSSKAENVVDRVQATTHAKVAISRGFEHKYLLCEATDKSQVVHWLRTYCQVDPVYTEAVVHSLYFDTRCWDLLGAKINGDYLKHKARLRWYSDPMTGRDGEAVFLEVKCRIGARREKARIDFPMTGVELAPRLFDLEVSRLAQELFPQLGYILPAGLFPAFEVRYHRYRFVDPHSGARLCVDSEITAPHVHPSRPATGFQRRLPAVVVEIKDKHAEIPFHLGRLTDLCLRKCSFSKYATCASVLF